MPLSSADVDELIVIFDERGTGRLDYRQLAHCLKLWRQEKKDAKKHRRQEALSKSESITGESVD
jgi:hypothetical protein